MKRVTTTRNEALKIARYMGCRGAHQHEGSWMPCADHETLVRISTAAEKSLESEFYSKRKRRRKKKKPVDGWEELGQRGVLSIDGLSGGGIVSGKAEPKPCWPGYVMVGMKPGKNGRMVPNCVPVEKKAERVIRRGDPDVYQSRESARARARQLGCIGIRQYSAYGGGSGWMPCTNESDYRRAMGTSPQGRRDVAKRELARLRRAMRRLGRNKKSYTFNKSASAASTPAPKKDRIYGSSRNQRGSAASRSSGSSIELSEQTVSSLKGSVKRHNSRMEELGKPEWSKASLGQLKAVWRRGAGAFSVSHRPGMTRSQWAFARVRAFLWMLEKGKPKKLSYITDRDLLAESHPFRKRSSSRKTLFASFLEETIESKARFIRGRNLGPRIARRTASVARKPKTDIDGDGDGMRWNPATGRDDLPVTKPARVILRSAKKKKRGAKRIINDSILRDMLKAGRSQTEIAKYFGVSSAAVSRRIKKIRTKVPKGATRPPLKIPNQKMREIQDLFENGLDARTISSRVGLSPLNVSLAIDQMKRRGVLISGDPRPIKKARPSPRETETIVSMYNNGSSLEEIAESLGRTYISVASSVAQFRKRGLIGTESRFVKRVKRRSSRSASKLSKDQIPLLKERYHSLRQVMGRDRALSFLAGEYGVTKSSLTQSLGADFLKDTAAKTRSGKRFGPKPTFSDIEKRQIQKEYNELLETMTQNAAQQFLSEYYDTSKSTIRNVVGRTDKPTMKRTIDPKVTEREERILELLKAGKRHKAIAKELGISERGVYNVARKLREDGKLPKVGELQPRRQRLVDMYNDGATVEEMAKATGLTKSTVKSTLSNLAKNGHLELNRSRRASSQPIRVVPSDPPARKLSKRSPGLTKKQQELKDRDQNVSELLSFGYSLKEIAERLGVSYGQVRSSYLRVVDTDRAKKLPKGLVASDRDLLILDNWLSGMNRAESAANLGLTTGVISQTLGKLKRLGMMGYDQRRTRAQNAAKRKGTLKSITDVSIPKRLIVARRQVQDDSYAAKELGARVSGSRSGTSTKPKPSNPARKPNSQATQSRTNSSGERVLIARFDPNAQDADGDGIVQEGTNQEREVGSDKPNQGGSRRSSGSADQQERTSRRPTPEQRRQLNQVNWQQFGELIQRETAKLKPGQQTNWNVGRLPNGGFIDARRRYIPPAAINGNIQISSRNGLRAISFREDGLEVLIPTIGPNGEDWDTSTEEGMSSALNHYRETGEHLGKFNNRADADAYKDWLRVEEGMNRRPPKPEPPKPEPPKPDPPKPEPPKPTDGSEGPKRQGETTQPEPPKPTDGSEGPKRQGETTQPEKPTDGSEGPKRQGSVDGGTPTQGGRQATNTTGQPGGQRPGTNDAPEEEDSSRGGRGSSTNRTGQQGGQRPGQDGNSGRQAINTTGQPGGERPGSQDEDSEQVGGGRGQAINEFGQPRGEREESEGQRESGSREPGTPRDTTWHEGTYDSNYINMDYPGPSWIRANIDFANQPMDGDRPITGDGYAIQDLQIVKDLPEGKFITFQNVPTQGGTALTAMDSGVVFKWKGVNHIVELDADQIDSLNQYNNAAINNTGGRSIGNPLTDGPIAGELRNVNAIAEVYEELPESMHVIETIIYQKSSAPEMAMAAGFASSSRPNSFTYANGFGSREYSRTTLIHELAHMLDFTSELRNWKNFKNTSPSDSNYATDRENPDFFATRLGSTQAWKEAVQQDVLHAQRLNLTERSIDRVTRDGFPDFEYGNVTRYGGTNEREDVAESFRHYMQDKLDGSWGSMTDGREFSFADLYPNRARLLDQWLEYAKSVPKPDPNNVASQHVGNYPSHAHPHQMNEIRETNDRR